MMKLVLCPLTRLLLLIGLLTVSLAPAAAVGASEPVDFLVVVHDGNPTGSVTRARLSEIFMKRKPDEWQGGLEIRPVDQSRDSPVRAAFTAAIHRKTVTRIRSYWQRQVFSGLAVPPPEAPSDQEVLEHVRREPGGVGYVSVEAPLPAGVKVLAIVDLPGYGEASK